PCFVEDRRIERITETQFGNKLARNRSHDERGCLRQLDRIVRVETATQVFFEKGINHIDDAATGTASEQQLVAFNSDSNSFFAERRVRFKFNARSGSGCCNVERRGCNCLDPMLQILGRFSLDRRWFYRQLNRTHCFSALYKNDWAGRFSAG